MITSVALLCAVIYNNESASDLTFDVVRCVLDDAHVGSGRQLDRLGVGQRLERVGVCLL